MLKEYEDSYVEGLLRLIKRYQNNEKRFYETNQQLRKLIPFWKKINFKLAGPLSKPELDLEYHNVSFLSK